MIMPYDMAGSPAGGDPAIVVVEVEAKGRWMGPEIVTVQNPAAGADWTWTGPTFGPFKVESVVAKLVTSATVANRYPVLELKTRDSQIIARVGSPNAQAASGTEYYTWAQGLTQFAVAGSDNQMPAPDLWVPDGLIVDTATVNIDAADQWSEVVITYRIGD